MDQPYWERVRQELNEWFADYPDEHAADLRARFRDREPGQHFGAWWELYLHRLFHCLNFEIDIHPELPDTAARPDFRITQGTDSFLLEAATTFSGIVDEERHGERESWIKSAIDEGRNPNFFVGLEFERVGMERPSRREIVQPIERWLEGLDPDEVSKRGLLDAPEYRLSVRDWELVLTAIPIKPDRRGDPSHRLLGMGPSMGGVVNDVDMLARTLQRKSGRYGRPREPFVLAVLQISGFLENEAIEQALLGRLAVQFDVAQPDSARLVRQRGGFWMSGGQPRATRVSAVITGSNLMPWTVGTQWPRLWPNPWARHELTLELPLPRGIANTQGSVEYEEVESLPHLLLRLPRDWPGPEEPFEKT